VLQETWDHKGYVDPPVPKAIAVIKDYEVFPAPSVPKGFKANKASRENKAFRGFEVFQDRLVKEARMESPVNTVFRDRQASQA
jgi:hypothetical protein